MAWEKRHRVNYYYRKHRAGKHVVSEYVGRGPLAEITAMLDQEAKARRLAKAQMWRAEKKHVNGLARTVRQFDELVTAIIGSAYLLTGHHQHQRQWRKRRE